MNTVLVSESRTPVPASQPDWRDAYRPGVPWSMRRPCGAWFRACPAVVAPRMRLLTMASCSAP
jgi:hypothetical protein